jgi:hypothetical protein
MHVASSVWPLTAVAVITLSSAAMGQSQARFAAELTPNDFRITVDGQPLATYVFNDATITRPYFANVHAPGGALATRPQPPVEGKDLVDHPTFHPGIWMTFGDISGADYWRLTAAVKHAVIVDMPEPKDGSLTFAMRYSYRDPQHNGEELCSEKSRYALHALPAGYLLLWDSTFTSKREFYFGDQEEMGLGLRVATPLRAQHAAEAGVPAGNGEILDAQGRRNEKEVWGNSADWCDYSGVEDGQRVGMTIFCHPKNFRPSWFHARDRGLLVANPFGRAAFHKGEPSKVVVKPGESLRLRYGVLIHGSAQDKSPDLAAAYQEYVKLSEK